MFRRDTLTSLAFVCRALLAASLLLRLCTACTGVARAEPLSGRVAAVPAGDTLDVQFVNQPGTRLVRLHGVECPASPRALKETAARFTARLALGTEVQVGARGAGPDGALWAEVTLAAPPPPAGTPRSLNVALVEAGLARWSRTYAPERLDLRDAQARASAARRGRMAPTLPCRRRASPHRPRRVQRRPLPLLPRRWARSQLRFRLSRSPGRPFPSCAPRHRSWPWG